MPLILPPGLTWRHSWSATAHYAPHDLVTDQGVAYVARGPVAPSVTAPAADPTHWEAVQLAAGTTADATAAATGLVLADKTASAQPHPIAYTREGLMQDAPQDRHSALVQIGPGAFSSVVGGFDGFGSGVFLGINAVEADNTFVLCSFQLDGKEIFYLDEFGDLTLGNSSTDLGSFLQVYGGAAFRSDLTAGSEYFNLYDHGPSGMEANLFPVRADGSDPASFCHAANITPLDLGTSIRWSNNGGLGTRMRQTIAGDFIFDAVNTFNPSFPHNVTSWTTQLVLNHTGLVTVPGSLSAGAITGPIASASVLGVVKVGSGLSVAGDGTLSASGGAGLEYVLDGGGAVLTTGVQGSLVVPFACTITEVRLLADQVGSIVLDIWKSDYAGYPPSSGTSIVAAAPPTISAAQKSQNTTLVGWQRSLSAGDVLVFSITSVSAIMRCSVVLLVSRV